MDHGCIQRWWKQSNRMKKTVGGWMLGGFGKCVYLLAGLGIQQDPAQFDDLGGILGDIDAMLVAGGRNVDDDVAIQLGSGC